MSIDVITHLGADLPLMGTCPQTTVILKVMTSSACPRDNYFVLLMLYRPEEIITESLVTVMPMLMVLVFCQMLSDANLL